MNSSMLKSTVAGLAIVMCCATAAAAQSTDDKIATSKGPLDIHAVHHASMMLTWNGLHVLVDPAPLGGSKADPVAEFKALPAPDVIVITHIHGDHFNVPILEAVAGPKTEILAPQNVYDAMPADLQAKTKVAKNGDKDTVDGIPVEAVPAYNTTPERSKFHPMGAGNGYVFTFGGKRVYIAGDTEETPELAHLKSIDVAFLPMNLPYTETVAAAEKWVKDFRPRIVYPYHYHNQDGTLSDVAAFKKDVGATSDVRLLKWY